MSDLGFFGDPVRPPPHVSGGVVVAYEVVTCNADGTVDLRNRLSRASRQRVPGLAGWTASVGDRVLAVDVGANPQSPAVIAVQVSAIPIGS